MKRSELKSLIKEEISNELFGKDISDELLEPLGKVIPWFVNNDQKLKNFWDKYHFNWNSDVKVYRKIYKGVTSIWLINDKNKDTILITLNVK